MAHGYKVDGAKERCDDCDKYLFNDDDMVVPLTNGDVVCPDCYESNEPLTP